MSLRADGARHCPARRWSPQQPARPSGPGLFGQTGYYGQPVPTRHSSLGTRHSYPPPEPITKGQLSCLQSTYAVRKRENDPRVCGPRGEVFPDDRTGRLQWAEAILGKRVDSFSVLTLKEAEYLLDWICKPPGGTKLDYGLRQAFEAACIQDPEAWFAGWQHDHGRSESRESSESHGPQTSASIRVIRGSRRGSSWNFQGRTLAQLTRWQKIQLLNILKARTPNA